MGTPWRAKARHGWSRGLGARPRLHGHELRALGEALALRRLEENLGGAALDLTVEDLAAGASKLEVKGARYQVPRE